MSRLHKLNSMGEALWSAQGETVNFYGFSYPTRCVVIRLDCGNLWIWSPINLTSDLNKEIDELGTVQHLVSPNKIHHLYLQEWTAAYPLAKVWGPASTIRKRQDLTFQPPLNDQSPLPWKGQTDQAWFRGSHLLDETEFFHQASSTAIIADLSQNLNSEYLQAQWSWWQRPIARLYKIDRGYAPLELRLSCIRRKLAQQDMGQ